MLNLLLSAISLTRTIYNCIHALPAPQIRLITSKPAHCENLASTTTVREFRLALNLNIELLFRR